MLLFVKRDNLFYNMNQTNILTQNLFRIFNIFLVALISQNRILFNNNEKSILLKNQIKVQNNTLNQLNISDQNLTTFSQTYISQRVINILTCNFFLTQSIIFSVKALLNLINKLFEVFSHTQIAQKLNVIILIVSQRIGNKLLNLNHVSLGRVVSESVRLNRNLDQILLRQLTL